jgi:hypothetical protein
LWALGLFIISGLSQGLPLHRIMAPLIQAICRA